MGYIRDLIRDGGDALGYLGAEGYIFRASDADQNDRVTGATSFADTTPTFLLAVPDGVTAIPLGMSLTQDGTVAGAVVNVLMEFDNALRYASGGTAEGQVCARTVGGKASSGCTFYTGATAAAGYGVLVDSWVVGQDVSPAEGAPNKILWAPSAGLDFLVGPSSWLVYTFAGTTGPTWDWSFKFAAFPTTML